MSGSALWRTTLPGSVTARMMRFAAVTGPGMVHGFISSPNHHKQGLQYDVRGLAALRRPADDTTGIEIDDDGEIGEALTGLDVGDGGDPCRIRIRDVELPVKRIIYDDGRPAAVDAGTAFVTNLHLYPGNAGQACDPVWAAHLSVIEKVVV